jgi:transcriptional regulator with XRE-family HTH domain
MPPRHYDRPGYATQIAPLVGRRIAQARNQQGLTQEQLGAKIGVHQVTVTNWESGSRAINVINLVLVADALDVPPASLLPGVDTKIPNALSIMTLAEQASAVADKLHALVELVDAQQRATG